MNIKSAAFILATTALAGTAMATEMSEPIWGINAANGDYRQFTTPFVNYRLCEVQCAVDRQCVAWVYNSAEATCWLKDRIEEGSLAADPSAIMGVKVQSGGLGTGGGQTGGTQTGGGQTAGGQ